MSEKEPLEFCYKIKKNLSANKLIIYVENADIHIKLFDEDFKCVKEHTIGNSIGKTKNVTDPLQFEVLEIDSKVK
jgi:hypothetical protein